MNDINEKDFRKAIKTLVIENPQKIAYFDGISADDPIPAFVPREETIERKRKDVSRRRRYNAGLIASAAACFVFVFFAIYKNAPAPSAAPGGSGSGAPMARAAEQIHEIACACPIPLLVVCIAAFAILFVVLFKIKRRNKQ